MIEIVRATEDRMHDINRCDGSFLVDRKLALMFDGDKLGYTVVAVTPYEKIYPNNETDREDEEDRPNVIFLAYVRGEVGGQIDISHYWNGYAYIENVVVDKKFRNLGIGRALVLKATQWSQQEKLAGVMLETQNNNVAACKLYESCGFELRGFDQDLYRGLDPQTKEIALFWYWRPETSIENRMPALFLQPRRMV